MTDCDDAISSAGAVAANDFMLRWGRYIPSGEIESFAADLMQVLNACYEDGALYQLEALKRVQGGRHADR